MRELYYVEIQSRDESGQLVPCILAVEAGNDDDARALILDAFTDLVPSADFGEVHRALRHRHGYIFTRRATHTADQV